MSRKNTLADLMKAAPDPAPQPLSRGAASSPTSLGAPVGSGALRAMGLSLEKLSADAGKARDLEAMIAAGDRVVELDPTLIDGSFVRDRIGEEATADASFDSLMQSISEQGQQVPILVRPLGDSGRYQVAYGHRRLRAVARLGGKVRAIVRPLTDVELVIAQARENLERRDLSYIEKAMFARRLEEQFDRPTLMAALGVDKADLSRLLTLASSLPQDIVNAIGPAPRAGRPRWSRLAAILTEPHAQERFAALAARADFRAAPSDRRFIMALEILSRETPAQGTPLAQDSALEFSAPSGAPLARLEPGREGGRLVFANEAFSAFVREKLPELARVFAEMQRTGR
ncbi:plasmid partitioning protein RepB [Camelimonas fluminis]|uniref:Plasmid partitioning protein RepB n=1 Tax=Camelimonas fluminis TaxID=1576911 RepID=A0ABV7UG25_9HYPH|nr:plasmid partitioning protein RepB [Camelimonas fluminis]GHE61902.1 plasmid partitioning protein RepB [Camelimonas fluminis]